MREDIEINSSEVIDRMKKICEVSQDKELAEALGLVPNAIHGWKKKNSIPFSAFLKISHTHHISIDWLVYGQEQEKKLSDLEQVVLSAFNDLADNKKKIEAISMLNNLSKGTHSTSGTTQTFGDNGISNTAGRDINMNKDTGQSVVGGSEVKPKRKSRWIFQNENKKDDD